MRLIGLFTAVVLCCVCTANAKDVRVEATPNAKDGVAVQSQIVNTADGLWVFCPGGQCPSPKQPADPPQFDFPGDEPGADVPVDIEATGDSRVAVVLSVIAAIGGLVSGYVGTRESEDAKDEENAPPEETPPSV